MQLKLHPTANNHCGQLHPKAKYKSIKSQLTLATCSLLAATPILADVSVTLSSMIYSEDSRVLVNEDVLELKNEIDDEEFVTLRYIFDTMSGPSPNGLPKLETTQTTTTPSGSAITSKASEEPTFAFRDTRHALNAEWKKPVSRLLSTTNAVSLSSEYDYFSLGGSSSWSYDFNQRMTTITAGGAGNFDLINPVGGTPQPFGIASSKKNLPNQTKVEANGLIGMTQIASRTTLLRANYSLAYAKGYLTDPYKLIGYLDKTTLGPSNITPYFYEKRPSSRLSHAFYFQIIQDFDGDVARASYRYFTDDWGINSHTYELKFSFSLPKGNALQLHYRYYIQTAANFYHYFLVDGANAKVDSRDMLAKIGTLDYASADYRLANLNTKTIGAKYSHTFSKEDRKLDLRLDRMVQQDRNGKFNGLKAWIAQIVFRFIF